MRDKDKTFFEYPVFNNIRDLIYNAIKEYPNHVAFRIKEKDNGEVKYIDITYKEFIDEVNRLGTGLFSLGLQNKKIAIIAKNRYEWVLSYIAILLGGMVVVPLDKGLTDIEIENSLLKADVQAIIYEDKYKDIMETLRKSEKLNIKEYICMEKIEGTRYIGDLIDDGKKKLEAGDKEYLNCEIKEKELAELVFTSGTTSNSKAVMLSQYNIANNISDMLLVEDIRSTDVNIAFLPFHHTFGSTGQLVMLGRGVTTVFPDGLRYIAQNLKEYHVTLFIGVPLLIEKMYEKIEKKIEEQGKSKLIKIAKKFTNLLLKLGIDIRRKVFKQVIDEIGGLRYMISGAASLNEEVEKGFNDFGITTGQGYGLTETAPVVCAENSRFRRYGSVGFPMKRVEIKIENVNEDGIGEIAVKGPNVMLGYYKDEESTKEVIRDGWFYTGDYGYIDKDGYVFVTGRKKNMIVLKNGKKIFPEELENNINKIDLVEECFVFGLPKGDDVLLSVKVKYDEEVMKEKYADKSMDEVKEIIWEKIKETNKLLPKYKYVKNMILTNEEFIKTSTNKIKRFEEMKKMNLG